MTTLKNVCLAPGVRTSPNLSFLFAPSHEEGYRSNWCSARYQAGSTKERGVLCLRRMSVFDPPILYEKSQYIGGSELFFRGLLIVYG
jgi:hypothetical protein